jgi:LPPG:FO 2-phospho-L-lactate transferase
MLDIVGAEELAVVANTADDIEIYGVHVSPDPDLVTYWLADLIDERGFGIRGDTWEVMAGLEASGRSCWFRLGDRDLAACLVRTELMRAGQPLTAAHAEVARGLGVSALVLPMADEPVRTRVKAAGAWRSFQEFMVSDRAALPIEAVELAGVEDASPTPAVLSVLSAAEAIVIGPSNPVISVGPILAVPGMRDAIASAPAPAVAVSPFVGGRAVKGPTDAFCAYAGIAPSAQGVADAYGGLIDGVLADEPVKGVPVEQLDTLMESAYARRRVARASLDFARSLGAGAPAGR